MADDDMVLDDDEIDSESEDEIKMVTEKFRNDARRKIEDYLEEKRLREIMEF